MNYRLNFISAVKHRSDWVFVAWIYALVSDLDQLKFLWSVVVMKEQNWRRLSELNYIFLKFIIHSVGLGTHPPSQPLANHNPTIFSVPTVR